MFNPKIYMPCSFGNYKCSHIRMRECYLEDITFVTSKYKIQNDTMSVTIFGKNIKINLFSSVTGGQPYVDVPMLSYYVIN